MPTAVIDSLRTDVSATAGVEDVLASDSISPSTTRWTLREACRRRLRRTGSTSASTPVGSASFSGMLVASDVSRHAPSMPS
jgi:hypothetical protein